MKLAEKLGSYLRASHQAVEALTQRLHRNGSYGAKAADIACHYKSPTLFLLTGQHRNADRVLSHIKERFLQDDGDFANPAGPKSENPAFVEYWAYANGWIGIAA